MKTATRTNSTQIFKSSTFPKKENHRTQNYCAIHNEIASRWQNDCIAANSLLKNKSPLEIMTQGKAIAKKHVPEYIQQSLRDLKNPAAPGYLVIKGLPIDKELPEPPMDGKRPKDKLTYISERVLFGIASIAGLQPFSYLQENPTLVHEIAPKIGAELSLSNGGRTPLGFHTDNAILRPEFRPEFLMLLGLINENKVPTSIASVDQAMEQLSDRHQAILQEPRFRIETPESFNIFGGKTIRSEYRPLVWRNEAGIYEIAGNLYAVTAKDSKAHTALQSLIDVLPDVAESVILEPGDLVIFSNSKVLHARAEVQGKRWLQRMFLRDSLADLRLACQTDHKTCIFDLSKLILR